MPSLVLHEISYRKSLLTISLFETVKHCRHIESRADMERELLALLAEARETYLLEVVNQGKIYVHYVRDFVNEHRDIECSRAFCNNVHKRNMDIVTDILSFRSDLVEKFFTGKTFTETERKEMVILYDTSVPSYGNYIQPASSKNKIPVLDYNISDEQMVLITACANENHLFCMKEVSVEDMSALLNCKEGFSLPVRNIRNLAVLFDTLSRYKAVDNNWKTVFGERRMLRTRDGQGYVSPSSLSSALSQIKQNHTVVSERIESRIKAILSLPKTAGK